MFALAKAYAGSQQNKKRNDPNSYNSLHQGSILQSGKRLLGWSAMRLKAHLDVSSPLGICLSKSAHPRGGRDLRGGNSQPAVSRLRFRFSGDSNAIWPRELVFERGISCRSRS